MTQVTLLTGPERRRRWSPAERATILAAAFAPGAVADAKGYYKPTDYPFVAGDELTVELDAVSTNRDQTVTLWVVLETGAY